MIVNFASVTLNQVVKYWFSKTKHLPQSW